MNFVSKVIILIIYQVHWICGQINMTDYYKMPPMALMDDYDRCLTEFPRNDSVYCYIQAQIQPDNTSSVWQIVEKYSSNQKRSFRHDRLNRGICMNWCRDQLKQYDQEYKMEFYLKTPASVWSESEVHFDPATFQNGLDDRIFYKKPANICLNLKLKKEYGLLAYSVLEYCVTRPRTKSLNVQLGPSTSMDDIDVSFLIVTFILLMIIATSSIIDMRMRQQKLPPYNGIDYYKKSVDSKKVLSILLCFSLPRNWYKLQAPSSSEFAKDLRPIHALRFLTMFCVIMAHCIIFVSVVPLANPEYIEMNMYRIVTMLLLNGATIIQTFFSITGFLMTVHFMQIREKIDKIPLKIFGHAIFYRYLRLIPVYSFLILLHATWLYRLQEGPIWPHLADTERSFCRSNWWTNLLFINNFVGPSEPCLQHGWYLAADFQLFIFGVFLHYLMYHNHTFTRAILGTCMGVAYIIPAVITYRNDFDGAFLIRPEAERYAHWFDPMYIKMYIPSYTNLGSFICGTIGGMLYVQLRKTGKSLNENRPFVVFWWLMVPLACVLILSGYVFYEFEFEKPAFWILIYAALARNLWGIFGAVVILGMAFQSGWIVRSVMCMPIFRPLGRLTFCAYLIHPFIIRVSVGSLRQPIYADDMHIAVLTMSSFTLSYLAALVLFLCLELPMTTLLKICVNNNKSLNEKKSQNNCTIDLKMLRTSSFLH